MAANPPTPNATPTPTPVASTAIVSAPAGSGQVVTLKQKLNDVRGLLEKMREQLVMALPKHFTPDRFLRITLTAVQKEPKLLDCYRPSFLGALVECAQLGLEPNTTLGQAYLVPFYNSRERRLEAQFMPGYKGLIKLAYQSGMIESFRARVVHQKDDFEYEYGLEESLVHKPHRGSEPGPMVAVYAAALVKGAGRASFFALERWECEQIRDKFSVGYQKARNKDLTPWQRNFDEMSMKSAARRLCKWLPADAEKSRDLMRAVHHDEMAETGLAQDFENVIDIAPGDVQETGAMDAPEGDGEATTMERPTPITVVTTPTPTPAAAAPASRLDVLAAAAEAAKKDEAGK